MKYDFGSILLEEYMSWNVLNDICQNGALKFMYEKVIISCMQENDVTLYCVTFKYKWNKALITETMNESSTNNISSEKQQLKRGQNQIQ